MGATGGRALLRVVWALAATCTGAALLAALAYSVAALPVRPLDGVEGEVLYEAARLRAGLAVYTDPIAGAFDHGPVPARFFVLYPPFWSFLLSLVPGAVPFDRVLAGRIAASAAWFGSLAYLAWRAPAAHRRVACVAAAFAGGIFTLALFGSAARPDAWALALSAVALDRAARRGALDSVCGVLFVGAALIKPNVLGIAAGVLVAGFRIDRRGTLRAVAAGLLVGCAGALVLQRASHGLWIEHLVLSTGQPLSLAVWKKQALWRLQFVGAPLALALVAGWRARSDASVAIALAGLAASVAWALVSLAKIGAASNYWMEPALAAVVVVSRAGLPLPTTSRAACLFAGASLFQAAWTGVGSVRSSIEAIGLARRHRDLVDGARAACGAGPRDVVIADEPGLEVMLNGRLVSTPFQMTHLIERGRFPVGPWLADVRRPEVRCLLLEDDALEQPPREASLVNDRFPPTILAALRDRFALVAVSAGWRLYRARDEAALP